MPHPHRSNSARVSPDRPVVASIAIILVALIMLASYAFSFVSIAQAAVWTGVPEWAHYLAPLFIDGAIATYTLSLAIVRWRGEREQRTLWFLGSFTAVSVLVNLAHAMAANQWQLTSWYTWAGCLIAVAAPIAALFAAEETTRLVFTRPLAPDTTTQRPTPSTIETSNIPTAPTPGHQPQHAHPNTSQSSTLDSDEPDTAHTGSGTCRGWQLGHDGTLTITHTT